MLEKSNAADKTIKPAEQDQEPRSESIPENLSLKARSILLRRRELYQNNSSSAQNAKDTKSAAEFIAIVKLFDSALGNVNRNRKRWHTRESSRDNQAIKISIIR